LSAKYDKGRIAGKRSLTIAVDFGDYGSVHGGIGDNGKKIYCA